MRPHAIMHGVCCRLRCAASGAVGRRGEEGGGREPASSTTGSVEDCRTLVAGSRMPAMTVCSTASGWVISSPSTAHAAPVISVPAQCAFSKARMSIMSCRPSSCCAGSSKMLVNAMQATCMCGPKPHFCTP